VLSALSPEPDVIYHNAAGLITMAGGAALDEAATAIAVRSGEIVALGPDAGMLDRFAGVPRVDLDRAYVMPGLIDCHNHFLRTAISWTYLQLEAVKSIDELVAAVRGRAETLSPGEWVICSNRWHETNLREKRLPTRDELDRAAPRNPVYLPRGGHVVVTNSAGLRLAGINEETPDPPGGHFGRGDDGRLDGLLLERPAFRLLTSHLPSPSEEEQKAALHEGIDAHNRVGITAVRDPGLFAPEMRVYQDVLSQHRTIRASLLWRLDLGMTPEQRRDWLKGLAPVSGFGDDWARVWGIKVTLDGGVEGGYFFDPYANNADFRGFPLASGDELDAIVSQADGLGWRVAVHVVGDAAMAMVLNSYEMAKLQQAGHTLEHAFSPPPGAMQRTKDLGLAVTLQHSLVYGLGGNMVTYWGKERAEACTPSREWLDSGVVVGAGTDSNVTHFDPWLNIYGFVTRDTENAGILGPEHRISAAEALYAYTMGSARILQQDDRIGSLELGKKADFIALPSNPVTASPEELRAMKVSRTVVDGQTIHSAANGA
jgi:predicted amidohydrolase YtcJ